MTDTRYLDTHDRCLTAESRAIAPALVETNGEDSVLATYYCPTCHMSWTCGWGAQEEAA